jgi:DNA-binding MarR family transcriptional regulator
VEQNDIKTLKILEALEENPLQSQRDLAKKLKISLGLVNAFTKRLARKGYFKITTIPKNRIQYILTRQGLREKARLTYQYFDFSMQYYKNSRSTFRSLLNELIQQKKTRVYFIGVSELAEIAYITLLETELELAGIIDDENKGTQFLGCTVLGSESLKRITPTDAFIITRIATPDVVALR